MLNFNDFYNGNCFDAYKWMGAHVNDAGVTFRTYAPNAKNVSLLWKGQEIPMERIYDGKFFETTVKGAKQGECYEFRIHGTGNQYVDHCDPYGFGMQLRPDHQSVIRNLQDYQFHDESWMKKRSDQKAGPLNIYEIHLGSWRKKGEKAEDWYRYDELASPLIAYLKESGYNYVEFMPLSEHPCDESWGYQISGFYAPTSRYGTMNELKMLIDRLHQNEIGVILDFVPVHFAMDVYGLTRYDGAALYEYPHPDVAVSEWGSNNFIHSKGEVRSFLQSNANYWMQEYHIDGLRMDAVSRMIYWHGDEARGENGRAIEFLKIMNRGLKQLNPGCILAAEDSTNYPKVTKKVTDGGLGFDYKWNMGWMHDTLKYFRLDPYLRVSNYHTVTFSMYYFRNEDYLLPLSHDEVVHGKATILQKMNGTYEQKFPQARAMYAYMMIHPGKKLNFMGNEIGQLREWDEKREQDWFIRSYPAHDSFYNYIRELNHLYLKHPALFEWDYKQEGFLWLDCNQNERRIYGILRKNEKEKIAAIFNFSDLVQNDYEVKVEDADDIEVLLYSDWNRFGGNTPEGQEICSLKEGSLKCNLNPFTAIVLKIK